MKKITKWVRENRTEAILLALILLAGAILRLYNIQDYLTFLGDEGRDVIIVRRLLVDFDPILVGPGTSIGNMYLGPLYYYMMAPFLLMANFSPVGPAVMVALLSIITLWLIWYVGREWFSETAGLVAAALYAVSPVVIIYSRSSWNPNIMPFFALLSIYGIWRIWSPSINKKRNYWWILIVGTALAFALQSHYLGLILIPVVGIFWMWSLIREIRRGGEVRGLIKFTLVGTGIFLFLMSPLLLFDARHGWINSNAIKKFFTQRQTTVSARPWTSIPRLWPRWELINTRLLGAYNETLGRIISAFLILGALVPAVAIVKSKFKLLKQTKYAAYTLLIVWIGFSLVGLGIYKQEIYDHYYGFFFPAPFLLTGAILSDIRGKSKLIFSGALLFIFFVILTNLRSAPIRHPGNRQLERSQTVSQRIIDESGGRSFNIAVIAERNYEGAYQYYLERVGADFKIIDATRVDETVTDQLFVVCELPENVCSPTTSDKGGVASFGWSQIADQWSVFGVTLYRLVHVQDSSDAQFPSE